MHFSVKNLKKFRRLRRRAWVLGAVLLSGCALLGGRLAWAHTQPALPPLPAELPPALLVQQQQCRMGWTTSPPESVQDALANPILHAQEEVCNESGAYPSGEEFEEAGSDWEYSSLEGLKRSPTASTPPNLPLEEVEAGWPWVGKQHRVAGKWVLEQLGWRPGLPMWSLCSPQSLQTLLPEGLALDRGVQAVEWKAWPQSGKAEVCFHLRNTLELAPDAGLETAWKALPNAPFMACMRREVTARLLEMHPQQPALRWLLASERWGGLAYQSEFDSQQLPAQWGRLQKGWLPWAAWTDHPTTQVGPSASYQVLSDETGTLIASGIPCQGGASTRPWESWEGAIASEQRVGAGRMHLKHGDQSYRLEWLAGLEGSKVLVQLRWTPYTTESGEQELATQGPDLEQLYTPRPNVIAGR